jgi:hypothetical protein
MPTLLYLVHGMGCGTPDGAPRAPADRWSVPVIEALRWIAGTFELGDLTVLDPLPEAPPAGAEDPAAIWVVPISYHRPFDEFRESGQQRALLASEIGSGLLTGLEITRLAASDFAWVNCLDVILWWADTVQARNWATTRILESITAADAFARAGAGPGGSVRRILISHSLGTAATTYALGHLARDQAWVNRGGFEAWLTLANVAPFLLEPARVYGAAVVPGKPGSLISTYMFNARHELDPVPWLLPWRAFSIGDAGASRGDWELAAANGLFGVVETRDIVAPPARVPGIGDVHGFANYLLSAQIAQLIAVIARGQAYSAQELAAIGWPERRNALPALRCENPGALATLRSAVEGYVDVAPTGASVERELIDRLLRAVEILVAARQQC